MKKCSLFLWGVACVSLNAGGADDFRVVNDLRVPKLEITNAPLSLNLGKDFDPKQSPGNSAVSGMDAHSFRGLDSEESRWLLRCIQKVEQIRKGWSTRQDISKVMVKNEVATARFSSLNEVWALSECPLIRVCMQFGKTKPALGIAAAQSEVVVSYGKPCLIKRVGRGDLHAPSRQEEWLQGCLDRINVIRPGSCREVLFKLFQAQGGLSSPGSGVFEYRECPYIKVEIEFETKVDAEGRALWGAQDKIKKISVPYLESTFVMD